MSTRFFMDARQFTRSPALLLVLIALLLAGCDENNPLEPTPTPLVVATYRNERALSLLYPAHWTYQIVREGIILFGEPETVFQEEVGASLMVYRIPPESGRGDLQEAFNHFMDNGPLRTGYEETTPPKSRQLDGREALELAVERGETETGPAMHAYIIGSQAESGSVYIITATAPLAEWNEQWHSFQIVVSSIEFNE